MFYESSKTTIEALEQAYYNARYYDTQFEIEPVQMMVDFTKELKNKLGLLWS